MNIVILILLVAAFILFMLASNDGDSKKGYIGLALWVLTDIIQAIIPLI